MLEFINRIFKILFMVIIVIALIIVGVVGFVSMGVSPLISLLVWIGGFIVIVLSAGIISMQIKMNDNLQMINDNIQVFIDLGVYVSNIDQGVHSTKKETA